MCALVSRFVFSASFFLSFCANHKKLCIQFKLNPQHSTPLAPEDKAVDELENTTHTDNHSHTNDTEAVNTETDEAAGATAITAVVVAVFGAMAAAMF